MKLKKVIVDGKEYVIADEEAQKQIMQLTDELEKAKMQCRDLEIRLKEEMANCVSWKEVR